jgi:xeroderma pigmentosum group C-complementing protein
MFIWSGVLISGSDLVATSRYVAVTSPIHTTCLQYLQAGEQPLKYAAPRRVRHTSVDPDSQDAEVGQYALFQTELYIPPPVIGGRIPKNVFGNLDVYVPSMVPPGAEHIRSPDAKNAARLLNIDYADAVTGFQFKGRHGTALINGIVIASEYKEAVEVTLDGFAFAKAEALEAHRSAHALRMWRRFLVGLRVVERLNEYRKPGEVDDEDRLADEEFQRELADEDLQREIEEEMELYEARESDDGGGGFVIEHDEEPRSFLRPVDDLDGCDEDEGLSPVGNDRPRLLKQSSSFGLEHFELPAKFHRPLEAESDGDAIAPDREELNGSRGGSDHAGGFLLDPDDDGGFLPEPTRRDGYLSSTDADEPTPSINCPPLQGTEESTRLVAQPPPALAPGFLPTPKPARHDENIESFINKDEAGLQDSTITDDDPKGAEEISMLLEAEEQGDDPGWERGSSFDEALPSEDPEDEDAEPEWLL